MKVIAALSLLGLASANPFERAQTARNSKSAYLSKLVRGAQPTENSQLGRRLDQNGDDDYQVDISKYSVKFEKCQFVKAYDDDLAQDEDSSTVLATKRFVIFRLCPDSCSSCNYNYGEYLIDLDTYLQTTVEYYQNQQEAMCKACEECAGDDAAAAQEAGDDAQQQDQQQEEQQQEDGQEDQQDGEGDNQDGGRRRRKLGEQQYYGTLDCSTCYDECQKINNMEANGYLDATKFLECEMIYDPEDDGKAGLYAGPMCASSGTKVKIGVFTDENCLLLDSTKEVDDYLVDGDGVQMKLSHALLKNTYTDTCISCAEPQEQVDDDRAANDNADADAVIELCENLYEEAAKCEKTHGFDNGYSSYSGYENQLSQETVVCDYMQSLKSGTYDEEGEIIVSGASSSVGGGVSTTGGQKFALVFFVLGTVGLSIYAAMLHSKLIKGGKTDLAMSGALA
ncbi:hypothetical protein MPSEU_000985700 [Mayamaea pseudoterrestris]|nr:hypothetical protein MPSEU_000985700 [Mayamaea pseudoterrestris]